MKKSWVEPQIVVDEFCANEYVAACGDTEYGKYKFVCDAPGGDLYYYKNGQARRLGSYHPCSDEHEASTLSEFPLGFVDRNYNRTEDQGESVIVWLVKNSRGSIINAHATTNLNQASWEIVKS